MTDPNTPPPAYQQPSYPQSSSPQPSYSQPSYSPPSAYPPPSQPYGSGSTSSQSGPVPGRTLGIIALIGAIVLSFFSVVWLILGIVALVKSRRAGRKNGFAVAAIIISIVAFIVWVIIAVYTIYAGVTIAQLCGQYGPGVYEVNGVDVNVTCG